ncbi:MAG TPA: TMEM175 family protein [Agriterribacter sp.]|nr:TMEM175 family protein [Agriterribacter sp.]
MHHPRHDISRTQFQVERFILFSDGIFAICITLLVIEIKVPNREELNIYTDAGLWHYLSHHSLKFLGFFISFGIIGHYWSVHHRIFGYVKNYTISLVWLNLGFLMTIVLLPFSSGLLGEYGADTHMVLPYAVYVANMCFTGFMNWWLWVYVSNPHRNLLTHKISAARIKLGVYRSLVIPVIFLMALLVAFFLPVVSRFIPVLIPVMLHWGMKGLERSADLKDKDERQVTYITSADHEEE